MEKASEYKALIWISLVPFNFLYKIAILLLRMCQNQLFNRTVGVKMVYKNID